jgi:hypothetical protein
MQAMTRSLPPQSGQVSMSMANTRLGRCIHWTGSPGAAEHMDVRERPAHGGTRFVGVDFAAWAVWHDTTPMPEVRGKDTHAQRHSGGASFASGENRPACVACATASLPYCLRCA